MTFGNRFQGPSAPHTNDAWSRPCITSPVTSLLLGGLSMSIPTSASSARRSRVPLAKGTRQESINRWCSGFVKYTLTCLETRICDVGRTHLHPRSIRSNLP